MGNPKGSVSFFIVNVVYNYRDGQALKDLARVIEGYMTSSATSLTLDPLMFHLMLLVLSIINFNYRTLISSPLLSIAVCIAYFGCCCEQPTGVVF